MRAIYSSPRPLHGGALIPVLIALRKEEIKGVYLGDLVYMTARGMYKKFDKVKPYSQFCKELEQATKPRKQEEEDFFEILKARVEKRKGEKQ